MICKQTQSSWKRGTFSVAPTTFVFSLTGTQAVPGCFLHYPCRAKHWLLKTCPVPCNPFSGHVWLEEGLSVTDEQPSVSNPFFIKILKSVTFGDSRIRIYGVSQGIWGWEDPPPFFKFALQIQTWVCRTRDLVVVPPKGSAS